MKRDLPKTLSVDDLKKAMKAVCTIDKMFQKRTLSPMQEQIHSHIQIGYSFLNELRKELE